MRPNYIRDLWTRPRLVLERCDELAAFTEEPGRLTRRFGTRALRDAGDAVAQWMERAGMSVRRDAIGNVIGRREGGPRTLLLGSHLDTVVDAGRYDGMLGVLVALAAVQAAPELPYAVELCAFSDEEGTRYGTGYLGSGRSRGALIPRSSIESTCPACPCAMRCVRSAAIRTGSPARAGVRAI